MATATSVTIECSGPAILAALTRHALQDCARFESELRDALSQAQDDLDLAPVEIVLHRWHALVTMAANPLGDQDLAQLARAREGDFTGLRERCQDGSWRTV